MDLLCDGLLAVLSVLYVYFGFLVVAGGVSSVWFSSLGGRFFAPWSSRRVEARQRVFLPKLF